MRTRFGVAQLVAVMTIAMAGCGSGGTAKPTGGAEADCAMVATYHGRAYNGGAVQVAPLEGERLGSAILPGCNDTGRTKDASEERIPVARLRGVPPKVALVWAGREDTVLIREGTDRLPSEVAALLQAPDCDQRDVPIRLAGPWLGILGADGNTEVDLVPPYDVDLLVRDASAKDHERAFLTVRVPTSLGRPLTGGDLQTSLLKGGTIKIVARCDRSRYIAQQITAQPPK
jgi:hypothetical protein